MSENYHILRENVILNKSFCQKMSEKLSQRLEMSFILTKNFS